MYGHTVGSVGYRFTDLRTMLAKASPVRSGDALAGLAAEADAVSIPDADADAVFVATS